jgi:hypothetical protein
VTPQQIQARGERILGRQLGRAMLVMTVLLCAAMAGGQQSAGGTATGVLDGVVNDVGGTPVEGAQVVLSIVSGQRKTVTDEDGGFQFTGVVPGAFSVTAVADGLSPATATGRLAAGEVHEIPAFALPIATAHFDVDAISQREMAELQIQQEEKQRIFGAIPNYFVSYDRNAVPLTAKQKFELSFKTLVDPVSFGLAGLSAGVQQAQNTYPGYGPGAAGYGKRFGASYGDFFSGTMLGGAILPVLFHQDPRYFYKGTGGVWKRFGYALSTAVIAKGDNGRWQPAYASMLGDLGAGAISNLYYPAGSRSGAKLTIGNGALSIAEDGAGNVIQEFLLKHLTPKVPMQANP